MRNEGKPDGSPCTPSVLTYIRQLQRLVVTARVSHDSAHQLLALTYSRGVSGEIETDLTPFGTQ